MSRLIVVDHAEGTRVPFLRGILTRSLTLAGLEFDDAYGLASEIRQLLIEEGNGDVEVSTAELRKRVSDELEKRSKDYVERYRHAVTPAQVMIRMDGGREIPFSRGRTRQNLLACGVESENALRTAEAVDARLRASGATEIRLHELQRMTHRLLYTLVGRGAAKRFLTWTQFQNSDRPLIILIGGTVGCGKSSVTTEIAHRLEIVRTQSTDMLREVMRMMLPKRLMPTLHTSSFDAVVPHAGRSTGALDAEAQLIEGFLMQTDLVGVACEAVLNRALGERVPLIIEGVHVHPSVLESLPDRSDAIVVPVMLALLKKTRLQERLVGRSKEAPQRRAKRYLAHFDSIWKLQSFLLAEADAANVPIVQNLDFDQTVQQVLHLVLGELANHFTGKADDVFKGES